MKSLLALAALAALSALVTAQAARAQRAEYNELVAKHAHANAVPEALVHRVILRESRYQPHLVGRGGTIGLMQIKLATARGLGYTGTAEGLRDPDTAETRYVDALALDPNYLPSMQSLTQLYSKRGDWLKAAQMMVRAPTR